MIEEMEKVSFSNRNFLIFVVLCGSIGEIWQVTGERWQEHQGY